MLNVLRSFLGGRWTRFSWGIYNGLTHPGLVTLTLLGFVGIVLLVSSPPLRQRMVKGALILLAGYWFTISPLFSVPATWLLVQFVPQDTGQAANTVVVLSRGRNIEGDRYNTAISMLHSGRVRQLFITGRHQNIQVFELLEQQDVPTHEFLGTVCARTTKEEAYSAAAILGPEGINQIILITDPPHMLRSWLTFKSLGFSVIPHIEPLPDTLGQSHRSFLAVREYLGLLSYAALGRFNPRSPDTLAQPARDITKSYPPDQCLITADRIRQWASQSERQKVEG
jgi:uncharacterized SAM-binding protein YcdF (DUF218 family)